MRRAAWIVLAAAFALLAGAPAFAQTSIPPTAANVAPPPGNAPMDPYLFVFLLLGGGLICLIAVVVTDNKLVSGYATDRKYTEEVMKDRTLIH